MKSQNAFAWIVAVSLGSATYFATGLTIGSPFAEIVGLAVLVGTAFHLGRKRSE